MVMMAGPIAKITRRPVRSGPSAASLCATVSDEPPFVAALKTMKPVGYVLKKRVASYFVSSSTSSEAP